MPRDLHEKSDPTATADDNKKDDNEKPSAGNRPGGLLGSVSSLGTALPNAWMRLMDEQRLSRLQQCQALEQVLGECRQRQRQQQEIQRRQRRQQHENSKPTTTSWWSRPTRSGVDEDDNVDDDETELPRLTQLEDLPAGMRMVRYFNWRNHQPEDSSSSSSSGDTHGGSCLREEHAVWACRAVALQCGRELVGLRDCFRRVGPDRILSPDATTAYKVDDYERHNDNDDDDDSCLVWQTQLGSCVQQSARALEQRRQEQSSASQSSS